MRAWEVCFKAADAETDWCVFTNPAKTQGSQDSVSPLSKSLSPFDASSSE